MVGAMYSIDARRREFPDLCRKLGVERHNGDYRRL